MDWLHETKQIFSGGHTSESGWWVSSIQLHCVTCAIWQNHMRPRLWRLCNWVPSIVTHLILCCTQWIWIVRENRIPHFSSRYILRLVPTHLYALVTSPWVGLSWRAILSRSFVIGEALGSSTSNHSRTSWRRANMANITKIDPWNDMECRYRLTLHGRVVRLYLGCRAPRICAGKFYPMDSEVHNE